MELTPMDKRLIRWAFDNGYQMGQDDMKEGIFVDRSTLIDEFIQRSEERALSLIDIPILKTFEKVR